MKILKLGQFSDFPVAEQDSVKIEAATKRVTFKKGESVFRQGEVCKDLYLIKSGLIKLCYLTQDGKEFIKSFITEGEMFGSLYSQMTGDGSTYSAIASDALEVEAIPYSLLEQVTANSSAMQQLVLVFFQQLALKKEIREYELLCLTAQQRYEKLCLQRPELVSRLKQADMALYLGITPIALSRIKRR